jgi:hypothetical protein
LTLYPAELAKIEFARQAQARETTRIALRHDLATLRRTTAT